MFLVYCLLISSPFIFCVIINCSCLMRRTLCVNPTRFNKKNVLMDPLSFSIPLVPTEFIHCFYFFMFVLTVDIFPKYLFIFILLHSLHVLKHIFLITFFYWSIGFLFSIHSSFFLCILFVILIDSSTFFREFVASSILCTYFSIHLWIVLSLFPI